MCDENNDVITSKKMHGTGSHIYILIPPCTNLLLLLILFHILIIII